MSQWDDWIGRRETRSDRIDEALAARWLATLDRDAAGDGALPQAFHWCLCTPEARSADLGTDGHPRRDEGPAGFLPPVPLPRRMWAASEVEFLRPLRIGDAISRTSRIASINEKQGGSGRLVFVEVAHETFGDGEIAVRETQSIVYREAADAAAPLAPPPPGDARFDPSTWEEHRELCPPETLLFRYS